MVEFKNEIGGIKTMPVKNNVGQRKADRIEQAKREILSNPENYNRIAKLAADLDKNFNAKTQIATNIRRGAIFYDVVAKKHWAYESLVTNFPHDPKTLVITEMAHHPLDEYPSEYHMVFYDPKADPSPRYMMSAIDFCVYVACGTWQIVDANNAGESAFLDSIGKQ